MRKISVKIGVTAVFALALFALSISQASAQKFKDKTEGPVTLQVDCAAGQSIQAAVDGAGDGDIITVSGTCTEESVTVTTDGITILGDGGTLMGGIIVDGVQRVVIDNLIIDGSDNTDPTIRLDGVRATNNAAVTVRNSTIKNHTRDGVAIDRGSNSVIEGSTITNNGRYSVLVNNTSSARLRDNPLIQSDVTDGPRTLLEPFNSATLGVFHNSAVRLLGGNLIENTGVGGRVVEAAHSADFRQESSLDRIEGSRAINIGIGSVGELRGEYEVTGQVSVSLNSSLRLSKRSGPVGVINGLIRVNTRSTVAFSLFTLKGATEDFGSVTVNGRLLCSGGQGRVILGGGQEPADIFPARSDQLTSQCRDHSGNVVLPLPSQCSDGIDNDLDGFIDSVDVNPGDIGVNPGDADPQCVDAADDDESS